MFNIVPIVISIINTLYYNIRLFVSMWNKHICFHEYNYRIHFNPLEEGKRQRHSFHDLATTSKEVTCLQDFLEIL